MFDSTALYDQDTFYKAFERDLLSAQQEVIIESPFITERRMSVLLPIFIKMSGFQYTEHQVSTMRHIM